MTSTDLLQSGQQALDNLRSNFYIEPTKSKPKPSDIFNKKNWTVEGADKLYRRIDQEINFLKQNPESVSSNISSLREIVNYGLEKKSELVAFMRPYQKTLKDSNGSTEINQNIDLILTENCPKSFKNKRLVWVKIVARKGTSIHEHCLGRSDSKNRNLIDQAIDISNLAQNIKYNFSSVKVRFIFIRGITETLKYCLEEKMNIQCQNFKNFETNNQKTNSLEILPDPYPETDRELILEEFFDENEYNNVEIETGPKSVPDICHFDSEKVNLDVTTMLSYCSNLTHGGDRFEWEKLKIDGKPLYWFGFSK